MQKSDNSFRATVEEAQKNDFTASAGEKALKEKTYQKAAKGFVSPQANIITGEAEKRWQENKEEITGKDAVSENLINPLPSENQAEKNIW